MTSMGLALTHRAKHSGMQGSVVHLRTPAPALDHQRLRFWVLGPDARGAVREAGRGAPRAAPPQVLPHALAQ